METEKKGKQFSGDEFRLLANFLIDYENKIINYNEKVKDRFKNIINIQFAFVGMFITGIGYLLPKVSLPICVFILVSVLFVLALNLFIAILITIFIALNTEGEIVDIESLIGKISEEGYNPYISIIDVLIKSSSINIKENEEFTKKIKIVSVLLIILIFLLLVIISILFCFAIK